MYIYLKYRLCLRKRLQQIKLNQRTWRTETIYIIVLLANSKMRIIHARRPIAVHIIITTNKRINTVCSLPLQFDFIIFENFLLEQVHYISCIFWWCQFQEITLPHIKQHTPSNVTPSSKSLFWQLYANIMSFQRAREFFLCAFYHVHFISYTLLIQWYHQRFVSSLGGSRIPWVGERCLCSFVYLLFYFVAICIFTVLFCINRIWAVYADSSYTYM